MIHENRFREMLGNTNPGKLCASKIWTYTVAAATGSSILEKMVGTSPRKYQNTGHIHCLVKGNVRGSALAEHVWESGHDIDWDS